MPALAAYNGGTGICDAAALEAARETGIPVSILQAIGRVESGRQVEGRFQPWPWTINMAGEGKFFTSSAEAEAFVATAMEGGRSNIDIGCFQINLHWHGTGFRSLKDMFSPASNARYAANFLLDLKERYGSWEAAVGAYHSNRDDRAQGYLTKVLAQMQGPLPDAASGPLRVQSVRERVNLYPLLQAGGYASQGSLVSFDAGPTPRPMFD